MNKRNAASAAQSLASSLEDALASALAQSLSPAPVAPAVQTAGIASPLVNAISNPCPFCGCTDITLMREYSGEYQAVCENCSGRITGCNPDAAADLWNSRTSS